jgi:hypothetical protein
MVRVQTSAKLTLNNATITGNPANTSRGIEVVGAGAQLTYLDGSISNFSAGIYDTANSILTVTRVHFSGGTGYHIDKNASGSTQNITYNIFENMASSQFAVSCRTGVTCRDHNNTFYDSNEDGRGQMFQGTSASIKNNIFSNLVAGIYTFAGNSGTVSGNILHSNITDFAGVGGSQVGGSSDDPLFVSPSSSDFTLQVLSSAIDIGTTTSTITSTTTDYLGNPIYGNPDAGAYEYQPPYTMGSSAIDSSGNLRVYRDGKFRYTSAVSGGETASLVVTPAEGTYSTFDASTTRPEYLDISDISWAPYSVSWTASSSVATTTLYTIGGLTPNKSFTFKLDGVISSDTISSSACVGEVCTSDGSGEIAFSYSGGYSTHTFNFEDVTSPTDFILSQPVSGYINSQRKPAFTWVASSDAYPGLDKYQLWVDDTLFADDIPADSTSFTSDTSLACGNHTWQIKAFDLVGNTTSSNVNSYTVSCQKSGGSVSGQVSNLVKMGKIEQAESLKKQWPDLFSTVTPVVVTKIVSQVTTFTAGPESDLNLTRSLFFGIKGEDVRRVQKFLNSHGFSVADYGAGSVGHETTMFGYATKAAVIRFQKANGINAIGIVGPVTRKKMTELLSSFL